jgi:hypothetical protein
MSAHPNFRGRTKRGKLIHGDLLHDEQGAEFIAYWDHGTRYEVAVTDADPYTGMTDRHGVPIYAYDYIYDGTMVGLVVYCPQFASFCIDCKDDGTLLDFESYYHEKFEVVGNIYDDDLDDLRRACGLTD